MRLIANIMTVGRMVIALLLFLTETFSIPFYVLYILCGQTDMADGFVARKTHTESQLGAKLDSIADIVFVVVSSIKILPMVHFKTWIWIWIAVIALIRLINMVVGYICQNRVVMLHTAANKITGLLLFILPIAMRFLDINYSVIPVCVVATFAALQEGYFIRTGREVK